VCFDGTLEVLKLTRLDDDVLALLVLVAFHDLVLLNGHGWTLAVLLDGRFEHLLMAHPLPVLRLIWWNEIALLYSVTV
jgi:hypothetical protein